MGALPPSPRDFALYRQDSLEAQRRRLRHPRRIPAAKSALELRLRSALPSALVLLSLPRLHPSLVL
jgi:hypothetical protein